MSYSFKVARDEDGDLQVQDASGDVPEGSFSVSGHHHLDHSSSEITLTHHHPDGHVVVRASGQANHRAYADEDE